MYPCTEISYTYKVSFERYQGKYRRGFWYRDSAQEFARLFVPNEYVTIRVRPEHPEQSYVFEEDQSWWDAWKGVTL